MRVQMLDKKRVHVTGGGGEGGEDFWPIHES